MSQQQSSFNWESRAEADRGARDRAIVATAQHHALRQRKNGNVENRQCTILLEVPGNDHVVEKQTEVHEKSVLQAVEALQKILRRKKTKLIAERQANY